MQNVGLEGVANDLSCPTGEHEVVGDRLAADPASSGVPVSDLRVATDLDRELTGVLRQSEHLCLAPAESELPLLPLLLGENAFNAGYRCPISSHRSSRAQPFPPA